MKQKLISLIAAVCMTAAFVPTVSFAEDEAITRAYTKDGNTAVEISAESGTVIAADYTGGTLTAVKSADVSDAENGVVTIEGIEADKVFLWDTLGGVKPLCAATEVGSASESPSPSPSPSAEPDEQYTDWLQGQANDTSTDGAKEVTEYEGKTALGVRRNVYQIYNKTMVSGSSMTFETYAYYASGSAGFRIVLENASAAAAQNSGKIVEAVTAGQNGTFGTAGETSHTSTKTGWFKAVIKADYSGTTPTVTASLYDPDGAAVFENENVAVPSDVTDNKVKAIRLVSRESADSGIYTYFADMKATFTGAEESEPTPPKPTPHPTAPPTPTPTPTVEPTFPELELPESKAWVATDSALNAIVTAAATRGEAFGPYKGLSGYGEWINYNNGELTYTHTNGKKYTFANGQCWRAGGGNDTERNFHFTPEAECTVTVAYSAPLNQDGSKRELYICQGGTAADNRLATGSDNYADGKTASMSAEITDTTKEVYIVGGGSNKEVYGIFVDYKKSKLYGTMTHEGGTDMTGAKIVFTDAADTNTKYETDFADTYAIAVENGKTYNISVVNAVGETIDGLNPVPSAVTVNGDTRFDVKIADLNTALVTGDVVVHEYTPNDDTTLDLSQVTLKFTDKDDAQNVVTVPAGKIENNRYSILLKPGKTYTVTAEDAEGYTLSPLSGEYALPSGEVGCFKNILLTEDLGEVEFDDTIEVGWDRTYTRINDAVAAIKHMTDRPEGEAGRVTLLLDNGVYQEQAIIDADYVTLKAAIEDYKPIITFYYGIGYRYYSSTGESGDDTDHAGGGFYSEDLAVQKTRKGNVDRWGPVVQVKGDYFKAENVIFANSFNCQIVQAELDDGVEPSIYSDTSKKPDRTVKGFDPLTTDAVERAAAMAADGNNYEFKNCEFISSQDTLFTNNVGYFKDCYIEGGTDYIFGGNSVIFDNCTLAWHGYTSKAKGGYITACKTAETPAAGTPNLKANGYLMRNCTVSKSKYYKHSFEPGGWGRNWGGENCQVVFDGVTIASGTDVPSNWNAMKKAEENKPFSFSILYINNVKKADGTAVDSSGEAFNPNGTMSANGYTIMEDADYFGDWVPTYYEE